MIKEDALIEFIANNLGFEKSIFSKEANIRTLCAISLYLESVDDKLRNELTPNRNTISKVIDLKIIGRDVYIDLTEHFTPLNLEPLIYKDKFESDGFCDLQLKMDILILEIEQHFHDPHNDDEIIEAKLENIGDLINFYCKENNP